MRRWLACFSVLAVCGCSVDGLRQMENNEDITGPALVVQRQALDGGCLEYVFKGTPLDNLMAAMPDAASIPVKDTGSPTATKAWKIGSRNRALVMQLPNGTTCSASVLMGDPDRLYAAAVELIQARGAFTKGKVDTSERKDAERTAWCTAGLNPYVVVLYRRTTGSRDAFLANVFKAQGATFSACRANG